MNYMVDKRGNPGHVMFSLLRVPRCMLLHRRQGEGNSYLSPPFLDYCKGVSSERNRKGKILVDENKVLISAFCVSLTVVLQFGSIFLCKKKKKRKKNIDL